MSHSGVDVDKLFSRYQDLQQYVNWTDDDVRHIQRAYEVVRPSFGLFIDDFYQEISRHSEAHRVITGGAEQINRLKQTLHTWLTELFSGNYDREYVSRRWSVGLRHVEIGLDQVYTNVALSRLRKRMLEALHAGWQDSTEELLAVSPSLHKLLDLDLAIIEDAYQSAYLERQQRTERLIAIGQMAGGVAHELRNPLNVVKTSVYYLLNAKNPSPEKRAEHLQRIERQVELADKVITALSDFAKLPFPEVRPVDVLACLKDSLEVTTLPAEVNVKVEPADGLPPVLADPDQLGIVFTNLIRNARDAMASGGTLTIRAAASGGMVDILISDTGEGISREVLNRITEPLYSTKVRGLGLGLAITRAIIEKHHGRLGVTSVKGEGSTFTVSLPAASRTPSI